MVKNVKSEMRKGVNLVAFKFQCLSSVRNVLHNVYVVFENREDGSGEFVPSPCSYCGCENGAFFCSHMVCFLYIVRLVQRTTLSQEDFEKTYPEDRRIVQSYPCLIENIMMRDKIKRQEGQSKRQAKKQRIN